MAKRYFCLSAEIVVHCD